MDEVVVAQQKRKNLLALLSYPSRFARKAYLVGTLGNVVSSPFAITNKASYLPTQDDKIAERLCRNGKGKDVVPYVYLVKLSENYSLIPNLCNCLQAEVNMQLLCDKLTAKIAMAYLVEHFCETLYGEAPYRKYYLLYFCSGRSNIVKEERIQPRGVTVEELETFVFAVLEMLKFLWEIMRFSNVIKPKNIVNTERGYVLDAYSSAEGVISTEEGLCLIGRKKKISVEIELGEEPYYFYQKGKRMPGTVTFYTFILCLLSREDLAETILSSPWGDKLYRNMFAENARSVIGKMQRGATMEELLENVKLRCSFEEFY